jgi:hypothetical protein
MAGGMVVNRFGPVEFIDARDRLPSVEATREPVPPVLQAVELHNLSATSALSAFESVSAFSASHASSGGA